MDGERRAGRVGSHLKKQKTDPPGVPCWVETLQPDARIALAFFVAGPAGETVGLWEPAERAGAQRVNEPGTWSMSTLRARDLHAATPFYASVFGWTVDWHTDGSARAAFLRVPGYGGEFPQASVPRDAVALAVEDRRLDIDHWSVNFWTNGVTSAASRIAALSGKVVVPPYEGDGLRRAVVADSGGAICTISQILTE